MEVLKNQEQQLITCGTHLWVYILCCSSSHLFVLVVASVLIVSHANSTILNGQDWDYLKYDPDEAIKRSYEDVPDEKTIQDFQKKLKNQLKDITVWVKYLHA